MHSRSGVFCTFNIHHAPIDPCAGIWFYQNAGSTTDALGCPLRVEVDTENSDEGISLPAGLFAILNGLTFFLYIPCALVFATLWKYCGDGGREFLVKLCFGKDQSSDAAEIAEKIGVGAGVAVALLFSIANLIVAGIAENCGTTAANAFIALNVLITLANVAACSQVSIIFYDGLKKCLDETGGDAIEVCAGKIQKHVEQ